MELRRKKEGSRICLQRPVKLKFAGYAKALTMLKRNNGLQIVLGVDDYFGCMLFALRMWYFGKKSTLDWRKAGRRDIGKYINDHLQGKLAELSFAKMLQQKYGIGAEIDLEIRPGMHIVNQTDLKSICVGGERRRPKIGIDVKATTPKSKYLLIDAQEFSDRRYDAYVLVFVDLPRDHLIRFLATRMELPADLREAVQPLSSINANVLGFAYRSDIEKKGKTFKAGEWLPDPDNPKRRLIQLKVDNYGLPISSLRSREEDWKKLVEQL